MHVAGSFMTNSIRQLLIALVMSCGIGELAAQGTATFTYQGQLKDNGTNANGNYTLIFKLYDSSSGGVQVGNAVTNSLTLANGLFSANLDFGEDAFNGNARWLEITVTNGADIQTLTPRMQVLPVPYAQFAPMAGTVTNGAILNAQLGTNVVGTGNIQNAAVSTALLADDSVTGSKLAPNAVGAASIAPGQVVKMLNGLTDGVALVPGANSALLTNGASLEFSATVPHVQVFVSTNAMFTVPTNVTRVMVEAWGGGGGGGSSIGYTSGGTTYYYPGGGGGAGGYAWAVFDVTPGTSYLIIAGSKGSPGGTGGTSSFGGLMTATGGSSGGDGNGSFGSGGPGGSSTGGFLSPGGNEGQPANLNSPGNGGAVWRGGHSGSGGGGFPAGGGKGANGAPSGGPGSEGYSGLVIVYY